VAEALGGERVVVLLWDVEDLGRLQPSFHFRSRTPGLNLAHLAQRLGGGGHPQASGAPADWDWIREWMHRTAERLKAHLTSEPES
jgi:nanoRNase/pAp phosphatase (c-di-AMP/oligoRNAs hydrolase)